MTDALCGPSNPLQNFQKHIQVDRTLQQDRLVSRQSPSQGFRSGPSPNAGILDPEFEAFQAGLPAGPPPHLDEASLRPPQVLPQAPSFSSGWASDFQRSLTPSAPSVQVQPAQAPPVTRHSPASSWHADFLQSQSLSSQALQPFQPIYHSMPDFSSTAGYSPFSDMSQVTQKEPVAADPFDMAAFERAFDAARRDMLEAEEQEARAARELQEETNHPAAQESTTGNLAEEAIFGLPPWPDFIVADHERNILEDALDREPTHDVAQEEKEQAQKGQDDNELSRVAGQLLDSVSHENSQKFQDSVFLQLMRKLRDKEVRVDGEHFVETPSHPSTPTASFDYRSSNSGIPADEQDADLGRFGVVSSMAEDFGESTVDSAYISAIIQFPDFPDDV